VLGEQREAVLILKLGLYHGAGMIGTKRAGLLYDVKRTYYATPPDEHRRAVDSEEEFACGAAKCQASERNPKQQSVAG